MQLLRSFFFHCFFFFKTNIIIASVCNLTIIRNYSNRANQIKGKKENLKNFSAVLINVIIKSLLQVIFFFSNFLKNWKSILQNEISPYEHKMFFFFFMSYCLGLRKNMFSKCFIIERFVHGNIKFVCFIIWLV